MKTKLDELLEKWREQSKYYKEHDSSQSTSLIIDGCILELEAIKDSLNDGVGTSPPCTDADRARGIRLKPHEVCLEAWMQEVTYGLNDRNAFNCMSIETALTAYRKSIGKP